jgi:tripartite-type tricarboxylate transporter receptor subunit TctC
MIRELTGTLCALGAALAFAVMPAQAQDYPNAPVKLIVPYTPGGGNDVLARYIAENLSAMWPQRVVVENKAGGGGTIGMDFVGRSEPDGYTLLMGATGFVSSWFLMNDIALHPLNDFKPAALLATQPFIVTVKKDFPAKTLKEAIELGRNAKNQISMGHAGAGTPMAQGAQALTDMAGMKILPVAYRGIAPALQDLAGGAIDMLLATETSSRPFIEAGKIVPLAITGKERLKSMPNLPTVDELVPGYDIFAWYGILAPAKTPPQIVAKINKDVNAILSKPEIVEHMVKMGFYAAPRSPEAWSKTLKEEYETWEKAAKAGTIVKPK